MHKKTIFLFFILASVVSNAQKLKDQTKAARDLSDSNFVLFNNGDKKMIESLVDPYPNSRFVKIRLVDGTKHKYSKYDLISAQTKDAFYRLIIYKDHKGFSNSGLSVRTLRGKFNLYRLNVTYRVSMRSSTQTQFESDILYFMEEDNNGNFIQLKNDSSVVNIVAEKVKKSKEAMQVINDLRKSYGNLKAAGNTERKLMEAVRLFNEDAEKSKLSK